ncbi:MAG TPA: imelysin family protein [Polyangiaceae bacterium]|jgi:putative iron-regulated protein|nr:imelysin family protein [Polyangiaceae bacterium]
MKHNLSSLCKVPLLALCAIACGSDEDKTELTELPSTTSDAVEAYAEIVHASYSDSLSSAQALDSAIDSFLATPSQAGLEAARTAWKASREPYLQTEVFRFYEGPIDNADDGPEGLINAWPLDEEYIDYVVGVGDAGMVNDPGMTIDKDAIVGANEGESEKSISTGYHAIEFLLWGQDLNEDGPGNRPYTDYVTDGTGTAENQVRRGQYLAVVSDLLVENLESLVDAWAPNDPNNYRAQFLTEDPAVALGQLMSGMIILSGFETGGERLQAALDSGDQEEEHSCFSDNTHRDMVQDVQGIQNVWLGNYELLDGTSISGPGIRNVIASGDAALADQLTTRISESLDLANALQPPFDREIAPENREGRERVRALVLSLADQADLLEQAFALYGLTRIPDPE